MIKLMKIEKNNDVVNLSGLKQRSEYLNTIEGGSKSTAIDFKFSDYILIISGWDLMYIVYFVMFAAYIVLGLVRTEGEEFGEYLAMFLAAVIFIMTAVFLFKIVLRVVSSLLSQILNFIYNF